MNKNDKLIVVIGVVILVIALIGIYTWKPIETTVSALSTDEFFSISSSLSYVPNAIAVSDSDPFYALIATPLAINYDQYGNQSIIPLYIQNFSNPSQAVEKAVDQIGSVNEFIDASKSAEEWSLEIAQEYWESSDAVLLIENNESGYNLGIAASPIASYLSIPVIVVDELDLDVKEVLEDLGVKYSLVCGDIKGHRKTLKFNEIIILYLLSNSDLFGRRS